MGEETEGKHPTGGVLLVVLFIIILVLGFEINIFTRTAPEKAKKPPQVEGTATITRDLQLAPRKTSRASVSLAPKLTKESARAQHRPPAAIGALFVVSR